MYKKRLDLHPSELLELRKQGYSNKDIANMLGICVQTVRNYIGRQDGHMNSLAAFEDKPKEKATIAPAEPAIPPFKPSVVIERYAVGDGEKALEIEIDHVGEAIRIETVDDTIDITYDQARELVRFLAWASDKIKPTKEEKSDEDNA